MFIVEIRERLEKSVAKIPREWRGTKHEKWFLNNNASKGKIGTVCYKEYLEYLGYTVEIISDRGDLRYRKKKTDPWRKAEVKTSKVDLKVLKSGSINEQLWFNQVRPEQGGWQEVVLVGIYPSHVRMWRMSRGQFLNRRGVMNSTVKGLSHVGTDQLSQVTLKKNSKVDNFHEWELIHNDQQGNLL